MTRAVVAADRWLLRGLLGPGRLAERVRDLEQTRAVAVDDSAALLRQVERDLHDGAQIRLATLAMHLGLAKEKLGDDGEPLDVTGARELVDAAHRGAKDASPSSATWPVASTRRCSTTASPTHSPPWPPAAPSRSSWPPTSRPAHPGDRDDRLLLRRRAAGQRGQAQPGDPDRPRGDRAGRDAPPQRHRRWRRRGGPAGSGLSGLAQRVSTVDGRMEIASRPAGRRVTVELPLHA